MAAALARGSRITGTDRQQLAVQLGQRYAGGESIRAIAENTGRSFGFVHGLVKESGVTIRGRGGATRGAAATATPGAAKKAPEAKSTVKKVTAKLAKATKPAKDKDDPKASAKSAEVKGAKGKKSKGGKSQKAGKGAKAKS